MPMQVQMQMQIQMHAQVQMQIKANKSFEDKSIKEKNSKNKHHKKLKSDHKDNESEDDNGKCIGIGNENDTMQSNRKRRNSSRTIESMHTSQLTTTSIANNKKSVQYYLKSDERNESISKRLYKTHKKY
ncbi:hypothetical protein RFI_28251 [Reticulomyxa filosa]|uniref:Uncharacterized protein n=1 Tax=Reticulomyxa filosa TaxID=46433 RepID=X6M7X8_RETFI|nr:hypothetical protein RFI_28251 [Reticulomyxa filosa]|eukprot:ETO09135.1 hypothetical protein RFI_28251 [Reticulomyxa filosa]